MSDIDKKVKEIEYLLHKSRQNLEEVKEVIEDLETIVFPINQTGSNQGFLH